MKVFRHDGKPSADTGAASRDAEMRRQCVYIGLTGVVSTATVASSVGFPRVKGWERICAQRVMF